MSPDSLSPSSSPIVRTSSRTLRKIGRIEHRHQRVAALLEQLGGARLVGRRGGDDQHRAAPSPSPASMRGEMVGDRIVRLVAAGAHDDVPRTGEQRARARLVGQQHGIARASPRPTVRPARRDRRASRRSRCAAAAAPASSGPQKKNTLACARRARGDGGEILLGRLHGRSRSRSVSASRVTICDRRPRARGSRARSARRRWSRIRSRPRRCRHPTRRSRRPGSCRSARSTSW